MVKPVQKAEINSFVKGLITEASPLNFPPDAERDGENFDLNKDGTRQRRFGVNLEGSYQLRSTGVTVNEISQTAISSFKWSGANKDPNKDIAVVQFGSKIDFYNLAVDSISSQGFIGSITLDEVVSSSKLSYSVVDGLLVITAGTPSIHIIEYDGTSLSYSKDRLLVRDLWGVDDGLTGNDINTRPSTLTDTHAYNLRNQGWGLRRRQIITNHELTVLQDITGDPINLFRSVKYSVFGFPEDSYANPATGTTGTPSFPANSDSVNSGLALQPVRNGSPNEAFIPIMFSDSKGLAGPAAKGFFIIDALRRGASRFEEYGNLVIKEGLSFSISSLKADITSGGASLSCDFSGRVFYSGFDGTCSDPESDSPILSSYILFSQVVKGKDSVVRCYQEGDPTSREGSDIVDTDGGFIRLSGAKKVIGMKAMTNNLFILADNGVWIVTGGGENGFTATNYKVEKLSSFGGASGATFVDVNDQLFFWGNESIFQISKNQFGEWTVNNISEKTIQKYYDSLSSSVKKAAIGVYDYLNKKIKWLFKEEDVTRELIFDIGLGAFSKNRIFNLEENSPEIVSYISTPSFNEISSLDLVLSDNIPVVSNSEPVSVITLGQSAKPTSVKFITLYSIVDGKVGYTFSQYENQDFIDWVSADNEGVDAKAFLLTGTITAGDASIQKQVPYLTIHFYKTENGVVEVNGELIPDKQSSCLMQSQWNWANSIESGKWGRVFQAYRYKRPFFITDLGDEFNNGFDTVVTKNKLRGRGRAFSLYLETEPKKDCRIIGWGLSITGNSLA